MSFRSMDHFLEGIKALIFELSVLGRSGQGDRINRLVFETGNPLGLNELRDLSFLLREVQADNNPEMRARVHLLETFTRNYRKVLIRD